MNGLCKLMASLGLLCGLTGCAFCGPDGKPPQGETLQVALRGNATTGYAWVLRKMEPSGVVDCSEGVYQVDERGMGPAAPVGVGGVYTFTLTALRPGEATLTFIHVRPWEPDTPCEQRVCRVRVGADKRPHMLPDAG